MVTKRYLAVKKRKMFGKMEKNRRGAQQQYCQSDQNQRELLKL